MVFLEISQNSQENNCARGSFLIKLQAPPATLLKKSLWHRCFPVNFTKFLRTPFFQNMSGRLLLSNAGNRASLQTQFARVHTSSLITIEKILNRPITNFTIVMM